MPEKSFGYGKMLEIKTKFNPSDKQLERLAEFMAVEPGKIPSGYTYLGQFIDHDIALDSTVASGVFPSEPIPPASIFNRRTPFFDLETIYGFENPADPNEPTRAQLMKEGSDSLLKLGETVKDDFTKRAFPNDLPRMPNSPLAQIVDSRNDENLAIAQTQVAFIKFHNAVVNYLDKKGLQKTFEEARKLVILHYQWIILHDFLPRIIKKSVLKNVLSDGNRFYFPTADDAFMPLEFSVAAYRACHSIIRNSYNWNRIFNDDPGALSASLFDLISFTGRGGMNGNQHLPGRWLINWNWFYEISSAPQKQKFNFAARFDTKIARSLGFLPDSRGNFPIKFARDTSLAAFDLYRTRALNLPSGQAVAKRILGTKEKILKPEQLANLLPENLKYGFAKKTPLWFYLLAEAEIEENGQTLGETGSHIIAETFVALLKLGKPSIFKNDFQPNADFCGSKGEFGMPQMLKFIAQSNKEFDELNPTKERN